MPLEPDLPLKQRFNLFQDYSEEFPLKARTDMFDYQDELHHMSNNRMAPPEEMAELREDYAAVLISNLRLHIAKELDDKRFLVY